jgi:hypothetical protein
MIILDASCMRMPNVYTPCAITSLPSTLPVSSLCTMRCRSHVRVPVSDLALSQLRAFFLGLHNASGLPKPGSTTLAHTTWVLLAQLADADKAVADKVSVLPLCSALLCALLTCLCSLQPFGLSPCHLGCAYSPPPLLACASPRSPSCTLLGSEAHMDLP